jgi:DNA repair photolyase
MRRSGVLQALPTRRISVPRGVVEGSYRCSIPLIRRSRLTSRGRGGVGKNLSDGWNLNFAVGCTHACPFCYVDPIHKRFGVSRYGEIVRERWGDYFLVPENLDQAIERTPWERWDGVEVMMSSTHDPYLPTLARGARTILEHALPAGVKVCLQTRSFLVTRDLDFMAQFREQVRLQVSIATMDANLARLIEPRVPPPDARLEVLRRAKALSIRTGVILAPILPPVSVRPDVRSDIIRLVMALTEIEPDYIYGESMHFRGKNGSLVAASLGEPIPRTDGFDRQCAEWFRNELASVGLSGTWWPENAR